MNRRVMLFYRASCPPCRRLSALAVVVSLGALRRVPLRSDEAQVLALAHPGSQGRLALVDGGRAWFGWRVVPRALLLVATAWIRRLRAPRGRRPSSFTKHPQP